MTAVFLTVLNMSITAGWLALAVMVFRLLFRKAPRAVMAALWALVAVRLLCPFSLESMLSLIPSADTVPVDILYADTPAINSGIPALNDALNPVIGEVLSPTMDGARPALDITRIAAAVWLAGAAVMLGYTLISYLLVYRRVREAAPLQDRIWVCDRIVAPFILGVIRPRIYLPSDLSEPDTAYVLAHETAHLQRRDHWWKPLGFLLLTIHWFNPILWASYILLCRDIEAACDEKVIRNLGTDAKKPYAAALVNCSIPRRMIAACPLAFGETDVKRRIRSVLHYKKPAFWIIALSVIVGIVIGLCFLTNPETEEPDASMLNYKNAVELVRERDEITVLHYPPVSNNEDALIRVGGADGAKLAALLDSYEWHRCDEPLVDLCSPGSIEFVMEDDHRITIYQHQGWTVFCYATVKYQGELRYYRIGWNDYNKAVDILRARKDSSESAPDATAGVPVYFYDKAYSEHHLADAVPSHYTFFTEDEWNTIKTAMEGQFQWFDPMVDRLPFSLNGFIEADTRIWFDYTQTVFYYDEYFCTMTDEVYQLLKAKEAAAQAYAVRGLEVYVWQMAKDSYQWALLPSREEPYTQTELMALMKSALTVEGVRTLAASYHLPKSAVSIHPIVMPYSSYYYEIDDALRAKVTDLFWSGYEET